MDERSKRRAKLIVGLVILAIVVGFAWWRKGETERHIKAIGYGRPAQQRAALRRLMKKKKAAEALTTRHRWVTENAAMAAAELTSDEAIFEYLATQPKFDAPVGARSEMLYYAYDESLLPILTGAIQDKDAGRRAATRVKYKLIGPEKAIPALMGPVHYTQAPKHTADYKFRLAGAWDDYVRTEVAVSMSQMPPEACYPLIDIHGLTEPPPHVSPAQFLRIKSTASDGLNRMLANAFDPIIETMLKLDYPEARAEGARLLGGIADQTVLPPAAPMVDEDAERVVEPLIDLLENDPEWTVQRRAAASLGLLSLSRQKLGEDEEMTTEVIRDKCLAIKGGALEPLIDALEHPRSEVRAAAAQALGSLRDPIAAEPLVAALVYRRHGATAEIGTALERLDTPAIRPLIPALDHPEDEVRLIATRTIAAIGGAEAIRPLAGQLQDREVLVRRASARALQHILRQIRDAGVVDQLRVALNDDDWRVYEDARDALANLGELGVPALVGALGADDIRVAFTAQQGLTAVGQDAVPLLLAALGSERGRTGQWAAVALGDMGPNVVGAVKDVMLDQGRLPQARAMAADALGRTGFQDATHHLLIAMSDPSPHVRGAAAIAIGRLGGEDATDATDALIELLLDRDIEVQDAALDALKNWVGPDTDNKLYELAQSAPSDEHKRLAAITIVLRFLGGAETGAGAAGMDVGELGRIKDVLVGAARDRTERRRIREIAVTGLGFAGREAEMEVLEQLIEPESPYAIRATVAIARIGQRTKPSVPPGETPTSPATPILLDALAEAPSRDVALAAAAGLAELGDVAAQPMTEILATAEGEHRLWLVAALAANGKPAVDAMLTARSEARKQDEFEYWRALDTALLLTGNAQARDVISAQGLPEGEEVTDEFSSAAQKRYMEVQQSRAGLEG